MTGTIKTALSYFAHVMAVGIVAVVSIILGSAYWYNIPLAPKFRILIIAIWAVIALVIIVSEFTPYKIYTRGFFIAVLLASMMWWSTIAPSNHRDWANDVAHTVTGTVSGDAVILNNVRNFTWRSETDYDASWESRHYDLSKLSSVDLFLSTWKSPDIAHTLVSFGFSDGQFVTFSVEIRKEKGEKFSEIAGFFKQYEIALIAAEENDIIRTRTNTRNENVTRYRIELSPERRRELFLSYLERGNKLAEEPAFYNTLTANCTTVVFDMIRLMMPTIPLDYRILVSGRLPSYIYELGGLEPGYSLEQLTEKGLISAHAQKIGENQNFSAWIRKEN